ncbi:hypothetical protein LIER_23857 [Lithospermum erythrorhizon]|uniref:DUF4283 domain-containing protein n=1 Tax=Lithospermum erythrorhizon TaxID=34254 RepID=A0AAV3QZ85_LITER
MVRPTTEDVPIESGGSYTSIEKTMKKKKKRKHPPPEENVTQLVASNVDPSFLVRVPKDNRVNMEGVLDGKMQSVVEEWGGNALSTPVVDSNSPTVGTVSSPPVGDGAIAPPSVVDKDCAPGILDVSNDGDDSKSQAEPEKPTPKPVSPIAGGSGGGSGGKSDELTSRRPKVADKAKRRVGGKRSLPPGMSLGGGLVPNRQKLPNSVPPRPGFDVSGSGVAATTAGVKDKLNFVDVLKDNRIVGNGLTLQQYDLMDNDDDVVLDESDEIPFVEMWGYFLIGCFTGSFPGRPAIDSIVKSWGVKCRIILYGKGWTVFRFTSDDDRLHVLNGGPLFSLWEDSNVEAC